MRLVYNPPRDPMSLLTASDLAKAYGAQDVFEGVTVAVPYKARISLVGPNGVGKTTLLRLLAGLEKPDLGRVQRARSLRIGYLPQEASYSKTGKESLSRSLWELSLGAYEELRKQEEELRNLEEIMADSLQAEQAMARYGPLQESFERAGGYTYPARIRRVLNGLGFQEQEYGRSVEQLSGGERTRAFLARLLMEDPDLLILDEPTNHLDIEAVEWLEGWLREWSGAALVVSHDRYFLDRTVDTIWELSSNGVEVYRGNYSAYVGQRAEQRSYQEARYQAQQTFIQKEQEYIRRNIAGQNTRQAQGRRKRLERLLREGAIVRQQDERTVQVDFGEVDRSGDIVLQTRELVIGYPDSDKPLFQVPDLVLTRGECVAVIGPIGAGKTTFLKTLLGEIEPLSGEVQMGASLRLGYFAQAHEGLIPERTVLQSILEENPDLKISQARDFLARFLFTGDMVEKPIEVLSGGERGRVAFAILAQQGANLLLLDEPTNHLDIPSQEILENALNDFPGTILLVSHDRYLIDALATQVWAITPSERALQVYEGGYAAYKDARRLGEETRKLHRKPTSRSAQTPNSVPRVEIERLEDRIEELEQSLEQVAIELERAGGNLDEVRRLGERYAELKETLEGHLVLWEDLSQSQD